MIIQQLTPRQISILKRAYSWRPMPTWNIKHMIGAKPDTGQVFVTMTTSCGCLTAFPELTEAHLVYLELDRAAIRLLEDTAAVHEDTGCTARPPTTEAFDIMPGRYKWRFDQ